MIRKAHTFGRDSPWPIAIESLMHLILDNGPAGMLHKLAKHINLSDDEVWYLWERYSAKQYDDARALEIIAKTKKDSSDIR